MKCHLCEVTITDNETGIHWCARCTDFLYRMDIRSIRRIEREVKRKKKRE